MKNYKLLLSILVSSTALLLASVASAETMQKQGVITVIRVQGTAEYSIDGGHAWIPVVVGKELQAGSLVRTGTASSADLLVGKSTADKNVQSLQYQTTLSKNPGLNIPTPIERNIVRLRPETTLGIDKLTMNPGDVDSVSDTELNLKKGHLFATVKKVSPSSEYLIKIPNGVAAVRGTQLELGVDDSGSHCACSSGTVWISIALTGPSGEPLTEPDGKPLPPLQLTLNPGQSLNLDAALINQLAAKVTAQINNSTTPAANGLTKAVDQAVINAAIAVAVATAESSVSPTPVSIALALASNINQLVTLGTQPTTGQAPVTVTVTVQTTTPGGTM